jgi:hypothetical protein
MSKKKTKKQLKKELENAKTMAIIFAIISSVLIIVMVVDVALTSSATKKSYPYCKEGYEYGGYTGELCCVNDPATTLENQCAFYYNRGELDGKDSAK